MARAVGVIWAEAARVCGCAFFAVHSSVRSMKTRVLPLLVVVGLSASCALLHHGPPVPQARLTRLDDRVRVELGGQLFTEYVFQGADRPYCYPVLAPDGTPLTRDFPMKTTAGEDVDHKHHRSLWFAHSAVNGVDFWNEGTAGGPTPKGKIVHEALDETTDGDVGVIRARDRWVAPNGKVFCTDETTVRFRGTPAGRMIDYEVTLRAPADAPVHIGDNKDGTMAVRLAQWMTMPHKMKQPDGKMQETGGQGHIVTSTGRRDAEAWGKRADWCDYHAERGGKIYGVAMFDHPENLRHPTWWMARDYGLFGANPFGWHDYEVEFKNEPHKGDYTIPAGGSLTLRYRLFFHLGDEIASNVAAHYAEYAALVYNLER